MARKTSAPLEELQALTYALTSQKKSLIECENNRAKRKRSVRLAVERIRIARVNEAKAIGDIKVLRDRDTRLSSIDSLEQRLVELRKQVSTLLAVNQIARIKAMFDELNSLKVELSESESVLTPADEPTEEEIIS